MILSLILLQVLTFVVIILVMRFLFGSQLKNALTRLQTLHQESLEKEEILNKELERAKAQAEAEIARAREEAKRIVENAKRVAEKTVAEAAEHAQTDAKKTAAEALDKVRRHEAEILAGAEEKAIALSQQLIGLTFAPEDQKLLHAQLIDELIENFKKLDKEKLAVHTDHAQVTTPLSLSPQEKENLINILSSKLGTTVKLEERVDASLVVGMVIRIGGLVIDGSLKNKLSRALTLLRVKGA